ncbi:MAG: hypothetical protein HUJ68_04130 [Clostridia bacterium]|nr:hypothetical protein [Clostridia bacterium]
MTLERAFEIAGNNSVSIQTKRQDGIYSAHKEKDGKITFLKFNGEWYRGRYIPITIHSGKKYSILLKCDYSIYDKDGNLLVDYTILDEKVPLVEDKSENN